MTDYRQKLQELLRELFQFDCADLDFGIYRIMNHKRDAIDRFIQKDLIEVVSTELSSGVLQQQSQDATALQQVAKQIREAMGASAIDGDGKLAEAYHNTPLGQRYLDLQGRAAGARDQPALEALIFNHLYTFFSRYYDNGDFISKRRYSKQEKYAIPYNGEEIYLHWANKDQYYVKTGEYFTDYRFKSHGLTVHFRLRNAEIEKDNNKGEKRYFVPVIKDAVFDAEAEEIVIPFEFRPLTGQENEVLGGRNAQEALIAAALEELPRHFRQNTQALGALLTVHHKNAEGREISYLEHHLGRYTRRNTSDFFIHKDLKGFLVRELDFYLKNEVLNLDELEAAGETRAEGWFQIVRVIRAIGMRIIEFLAQIEDFQKKLYEKKKFITETQYCITVGNIPEEFYGEIADNEAQWVEWKDLYHLDEERRDVFTTAANGQKERRIVILKAHPALVLDTKHFNEDFRDRLLACFDDLDEQTDGLLIHGENYQALNLLAKRYQGKVKCIYIDPPYNTGNGDFLYKDAYRHSCWLSMIKDRCLQGRSLLRTDGVFFSHVDDNELFLYKQLLDSIFGLENFICSFVWIKRYGPPPDTKDIGYTHESILAYKANSDFQRNLLPLTVDQVARYQNPDNDPRGPWKPMDYTCRYTSDERPNLYYPIINPNTGEEIWPKKSRVWAYSREEHDKNMRENRIWWGINGQSKTPALKNFLNEIQQGMMPTTVLHYDQVGHTDEAAKELRDFFPNMKMTPKPTRLINHLIKIAASNGDIILDYFAGTGSTAHAIVSFNMSNNCRIKFILVEMADYFDSILLKRVKKTIFSQEWKDGKPIRELTEEEAMRSPRIIKYIGLESYEDALNNISFTSTGGSRLLEFDDYLLKYMLDWETRGSATLLNVEMLASPFSYELTLIEGQETKRKRVDIPETFNYLLGLHVQKRLVFRDGDRRYLVYRGELDRRRVAVIWRETKGWGREEYERDKRFVAEQKIAEGADEIFVNGDSFIPGARALEPIFKSRMFGGV